MVNFTKYGIGSCSPSKWFGLFVVVVNVIEDCMTQFLDRTEASAPAALGGDFSEKAFDLVEPTGVGGDEVNMPTRMLHQPFANCCSLMGSVVVDDDVQIEFLGGFTFNFTQESEKLFLRVTLVAIGVDLAGFDIESGEKCGCAMAEIIARAPFRLTGSHGQQRLAAFECLYLTFLVYAQHQCVLRRSHVKAHHITNLFYKKRIGRELEALGPVRLQTKGLPDAGHPLIGDADFGGHLAGAPMSGIGWPTLKGQANHLGDLLVANLAGRAAAGKIGQALQTVLEKTAAPSPNSVLAKAHTLTNGRVGQTLSQSKTTRARRASALLEVLRRTSLRRVSFSSSWRINSGIGLPLVMSESMDKSPKSTSLFLN